MKEMLGREYALRLAKRQGNWPGAGFDLSRRLAIG